MRDLWDAEAQRNNVLPISDGLVDRFGGFIPPAWPAGPTRTFLPGGGPVADESVPMLWGGFDITADIDTDRDGADGVVFALGDWFGGYALYLVEGRVHFTFARAADALELMMAAGVAAGHHDITVSYAVGDGDGLGRMVLTVDGVEVDETAVEGMLPLAVQHGGAGLRLGGDSGFPVSSRYAPPAPFEGTVHGVRVDTPGSLRPDPADEVRAALHAD
jgi:arylsulfatase